MKDIFDREARKRFDDQHLQNRRKVCCQLGCFLRHPARRRGSFVARHPCG